MPKVKKKPVCVVHVPTELPFCISPLLVGCALASGCGCELLACHTPQSRSAKMEAGKRRRAFDKLKKKAEFSLKGQKLHMWETERWKVSIHPYCVANFSSFFYILFIRRKASGFCVRAFFFVFSLFRTPFMFGIALLAYFFPKSHFPICCSFLQIFSPQKKFPPPPPPTPLYCFYLYYNPALFQKCCGCQRMIEHHNFSLQNESVACCRSQLEEQSSSCYLY